MWTHEFVFDLTAKILFNIPEVSSARVTRLGHIFIILQHQARSFEPYCEWQCSEAILTHVKQVVQSGPAYVIAP